MTIVEKIKSIYTELDLSEFHPARGSILLQNDGTGDYIKEWNHPTYARPTQEQLDAVE